MSDETRFTQEEVDQFRTALTGVEEVKTQIKEQKAAGDGVAEKQVELDKRVTDLLEEIDPTDIKEKIARIETKLSRKDSGDGGYEEKRADLSKQMKAQGLAKWYTNNMKAVPEDVKALLVNDGSSAGFLVPDDYRTEIIEQLAVELDPIRQYARVIKTDRNSVIIPTKTAHAAGSWIGEGGTITADTTLAFGQVEIPTHKQAIAYDVSREMLEDSAFDIASILMQEFTQETESDAGIAFVSGSGSNQPEGFILNAGIVANYVASGTDASITSDWAWAQQLMVKVKQNYMQNAITTMNRTTYGLLLSNADGEARPYMLPDASKSLPLSLYGRPIVLSVTMPDVASDAEPIAYGDFRQGYCIVDKTGLQVQVDPFTQNMTDKIRYVAIRRVGGAVINDEAIAVVKCATS